MTRPGGRRTAAARAVILALSALAVAAGCGGGSGGSGDGPGRGTLTVFAASSLTEPFGTLATTFEKQHPGVRVRFSFDSSATLAEQVTQGAPADVLATADTTTMKTAVAANANDGRPQVFATNTLVTAVPAANPGQVTAFSDLDKPGVGYLTCVETAPCGALARTLLDENHITAQPRSQEVDVKSVLSKVELGEADAGLVYASDAKAAGSKVTAVPIPHAAQHVNDYPIVALEGAKSSALAHDWVRLVLSGRGRQVLRDAGFGPP